MAIAGVIDGGIMSVVRQLQATATLAAGGQADKAQGAPGQYQGVDFASELRAALGRVSEAQQTAQAQAQRFSLDEPGVSLNEVMVDLQKSSLSLQMGVQVRNKLVAAYQDIMAMQV